MRTRMNRTTSIHYQKISSNVPHPILFHPPGSRIVEFVGRAVFLGGKNDKRKH
jgi:hypothetical protein